MDECLVVQHVAPEGPAMIGAALAAADVPWRVCRVDRGEPVPDSAAALPGLVVMGGPMSAATDQDFPSRRAELALLRSALELSVPVLGVCLGAQLLALASGGRVMTGAQGSEIGWGPVRLTDAGRAHPLFAGAPAEIEVLHWHADTFDVPPGAVLLASSDCYAHQAFRVGPQAWGLQFHLEVDEPTVAGFANAFGPEARAAGVEPRQLTGRAATAVPALTTARDAVLGNFVGRVRLRSESTRATELAPATER